MRAVTTIVFMAPISAFDEILAEDPSVNRLVGDFLYLLKTVF
jgi:hypothetical protein